WYPMRRMFRMFRTNDAPVVRATHERRRVVRPCAPWLPCLPRATRGCFVAAMGAGDKFEPFGPRLDNLAQARMFAFPRPGAFHAWHVCHERHTEVSCQSWAPDKFEDLRPRANSTTHAPMLACHPADRQHLPPSAAHASHGSHGSDLQRARNISKAWAP